jgi:transcriptional regulator with XRE-family HTH domain
MSKNHLSIKESEAFRRIRLVAGLNLKTVADRAGVTSVRLSRIEAGASPVDTELMAKLLAAIGLSAKEFNRVCQGGISFDAKEAVWFEQPKFTASGASPEFPVGAAIALSAAWRVADEEAGNKNRRSKIGGGADTKYIRTPRTYEDGVELARHVRHTWQLGAESPIADLSCVLGGNGVLLVVDDVTAPGCGLVNRMPVIVVSSSLSPVDQRVQAVELLYPCLLNGRKRTKLIATGKVQGRKFAGAFLLPDAMIRRFALTPARLNDTRFTSTLVQILAAFARVSEEFVKVRLSEWSYGVEIDAPSSQNFSPVGSHLWRRYLAALD